MPLFGRRQQQPARMGLVASATSAGDRKTSGGLRRLSQQWQHRALEYYDTVGECWYPAQSYARTMEKIRFFPAILNDLGEPEEVETGRLVELFDMVQDPGGSGRTELVGAYGRLMFLTGDGYLTVTEEDDQEAWEFLSPVELRVKPDGGTNRPQEYQRVRAQGMTPEELVEASDDDFEPLNGRARVWRLWRRHPMYTAWADSPIKAVLDLYELLHRLTLAAAAESQSRAASRGLLYVPEELRIQIAGAEVEPSEDPQQEPLFARLVESMTVAIQDPGSPAAMAPITLRGPGLLNTPSGAMAMADAIKLIQLNSGERYLEVEAWEKTIARISYGLDMPGEFVTGTGDTNHWGGWLLDEQQFRQHVAPIAQRFCDDLASAYLRPAAIADGVENAERVVIAYDPAEAVNHPDEINTAKEAYENAVVSAAYYRDAIGATEDDAPTPEDLEIIFALRSKTPPGEEDEEGETPPEEGGRGGDVDEQPPEQEEQRGSDNTVAASALLAARVMGAAELAIERSRELAGSRLRRRSQGCQPCQEQIKSVHATLVASTLGPETVREIIDGHSTLPALVEGSADPLKAKLGEWGIPGTFAERIGQMVEEHALRTLFAERVPPLPTGFSAVVAKALQ